MVLAILVAALGYFVDVFDLLLFSMVRVSSLTSLGYSGDELVTAGAYLLNLQLIGALVGGVFFGILGDKRGRVYVLFGSILIYSIATLLNAFVTSLTQYAILRFIAGFGLAGELGAGVTLVSELMSKEKRGYATTIVASFGMGGVITASFITQHLSWQASYIIGGLLGLALLALRIGVHESGMFSKMHQGDARRGDLRLLFSNWERTGRFISAVLVALPIWFVVGILGTFSPELGFALGIQETVSAGKLIGYLYLGVLVGDVASGLLSQWFRSRRKSIWVFLLGEAICSGCYLLLPTSEPEIMMWAVAIGFFAGYWAVFITAAAEQFGTNLRATVATIAPNIIRGSTVFMTLGFTYLKPSQGAIAAAGIVGVICFLIGVIAVLFSKETFGRDLDFIEE
jgi:putative MFS transporter